MVGERPLISVVDDSESVRESIPDLLEQFGFDARVFGSAETFLASGAVSSTNCLLLDVGLPGMSGPDLHHALTLTGHSIPTVFITAQREASLGQRLIAAGAVACLFKPFSDDALFDAITAALAREREHDDAS